ncbi:conserved hypothetical protein [uncultured Desulfobacterium sp.]|uniref:Uncharacterized protein n=1 Tax=uncultured Desulfobacterium sp. TaxID=201089 RepID=A0A445N054_9BACT|nr:conserved hypothetical protein [uncultured Desulfobacterium sp.]
MEKQVSRLEELKGEGWTRQFVACEPRLSEAVELYKESGYDVHLEPMPKADNPFDFPQAMTGSECTTCFEGSEENYRIIFTRPTKGGLSLGDELFD